MRNSSSSDDDIWSFTEDSVTKSEDHPDFSDSRQTDLVPVKAPVVVSPLEELFLLIIQDRLELVMKSPQLPQLMQAKDSMGRSPLFFAAQRGKNHFVQAFLTKFPETIEQTDNESRTALFISSLCGHQDVVRTLLDANANTEAKEAVHNWTPLYAAIVCAHNGVFDLLLSHSAKFELNDNQDQTPLWVACLLNRTKLAVKLLDAQANINCVDKFKRSALYIACQKGNRSTVIQLLRRGCNLELADIDGRTPYMIARQFAFTKIMSLLEKAGAKPPRIVSPPEKPFKGIRESANVWPLEPVLAFVTDDEKRLWGYTNCGSVVLFDTETYDLIAYSKKLLLPSTTAQLVFVAGKIVVLYSCNRLAILKWQLDPTEGKTSHVIALPKSKSIKIIEDGPLLNMVHWLTVRDTEIWGFCSPGYFKVFSTDSVQVVRRISLDLATRSPEPFPTPNECICRVIHTQGMWFISSQSRIHILRKDLSYKTTLDEEESDEILSMVIKGDYLWVTGRFDFVVRIWDWKQGRLIKSLHSAQELLVTGNEIIGRIHDKVNAWDATELSCTGFLLQNLKRTCSFYWTGNRLWIGHQSGELTVYR